MTKYQTPTDDQVRGAIRRIISPQLRRAFFEGLNNPLWVEPLAKYGLFDNPPEQGKGEGGLPYDVYWPEVDYLVRIAPAKPAEVVDILLKLSRSNNAWLKRAAFSIGLIIPPNQAARLKPLFKTWLRTDFGWRTDHREMVSLAVKLLGSGERKTGIWLADILFKPMAPKDEESSGFFRKPALFLREHWYIRGLADVVEVLQPTDLYLVVGWLLAYERSSGHYIDGRDISHLSRESIRVRAGLGTRRSVEQSLIEGVREVAVKAVRDDAAMAVSALLAPGMALTRKIALHSVGVALSEGEPSDEHWTDLMAAATNLLFDSKCRDHVYRIEYGELARAVASHDPSALEPLTAYLDEGPLTELAELRRRLRGDSEESPEHLEAGLTQYLSGWRHQWLAAIGKDALPQVLRNELVDLEAKRGPIENPLEPSRVTTTWTGPNSPLSQDEIAAMGPEEIVGYLENWRTSGDGWGPEPSHEGLGRQLTSILTTNPLAVAGTDRLVDRLRPTYLRAIFEGWESAAKAGIAPDWTQVAEVLRGVLTHPDASVISPEGDEFDDDPDFRGAKKAAIGLLEELVKSREDRILPDESLATFSTLLLSEGADEVAWEEYDGYQHADDMDPLTISINWQWPIRLNALVGLLSHGKDTSWYVKAKQELEREIARPDRRGASRAVLGASLGRFLNVDSSWIERRVPDLFGSTGEISKDQQISLTTALAAHRYHPHLYDLLAGAMIAALNSDTPIVSGWENGDDPILRIGEWVVTAIAVGDKTSDDAVATALFTNAEPATRGVALGRIAGSLKDASNVDQDVLNHLGGLWDERVAHVRAFPEDRAELLEFYWFVHCQKFPEEWWLPRLKVAVELSNGTFSTHGLIGKTLSLAARNQPREAFEVLKLLLAQRSGDADLLQYDLHERAVPFVLAFALDSGSKDLVDDAAQVMNQLGAEGFLQLEAQVKKVMAGTAAELEDD
ncbi:hypothetical protein [Paenarthrobacter nicotinovorans]|uniref:hypothetical protein n=1 Tax=Paenarthrobacter nicotinovorans TaxID=29320 RepID=UPI0011A57672|nr:hypothetical protein [Paenarthrobacter nicotinovorans]